MFKNSLVGKKPECQAIILVLSLILFLNRLVLQLLPCWQELLLCHKLSPGRVRPLLFTNAALPTVRLLISRPNKT